MQVPLTMVYIVTYFFPKPVHPIERLRCFELISTLKLFIEKQFYVIKKIWAIKLRLVLPDVYKRQGLNMIEYYVLTVLLMYQC